MPRPRLRRFLQIFFALLCGGILWAGWYGAKRGLTRSWRERVFAEFRARGVEITFKKLTADPLRGFVAREVIIFDANDRQRTLAEVDQLTLNIDWSRLLRRKPFISALELRDARLSLPLDRHNPQSRRIDASHLQARLLFPEKQIRLVSAEARLMNFNLKAEGWISNPSQPEEKDPNQTPEWLPAVERAIEELQAVQWKGDGPQMRIQFSGDMDAPESVAATLHIESAGLIVKGYELSRLSLSASWKEGALEIPELELADSKGRLRAVGRWTPAGPLEVRVESSLDPVKLAEIAGQPLPPDTLQITQRPVVRVHLEGGPKADAPLRVTGSLEATAFSWKKELFESLKASGSWEKDKWSAREVRLVHKQGTLTGDVMSLPGEFRVSLKSTLPLPVIEVALPPQPESSPLHWLQTSDPLQIEVDACGSAPDLNLCTAWGRVQVGRCTFRGVAVEKFNTPFRLKGGVWSFGSFQIKRSEGSGSGSVTYDAVHNDLFLHDLRLQLNPQETMQMVEPEWLKEVKPYRFRGPAPVVTVKGKATPHSAENTNIQVTVESKTGMDYDFAGKTLPISAISGEILFTPRRVRITPIQATLFNGKVNGNVDISIKPDGAPHKASLYITNMDFAALSRLYTGYEDSKGLLNCSFLWKGDDDDGRKVDGSGELSITDGNVFVIPFLGPLSTLLNAVIPGLGMSTAHKATASFTVKDGVFNTRNLHIDGGGFSLLGHGDLRFMDDSMLFYARVNARSLPGLVLFPVSKLFEYAADCKLSNPVWKSRILSRKERSGADPTPSVPEPPEAAPQ